jgi:hypothetical protein
MEILAIATNGLSTIRPRDVRGKMTPRAQLSTTKHDSVPQSSRGFK